MSNSSNSFNEKQDPFFPIFPDSTIELHELMLKGFKFVKLDWNKLPDELKRPEWYGRYVSLKNEKIVIAVPRNIKTKAVSSEEIYLGEAKRVVENLFLNRNLIEDPKAEFLFSDIALEYMEKYQIYYYGENGEEKSVSLLKKWDKTTEHRIQKLRNMPTDDNIIKKNQETLCELKKEIEKIDGITKKLKGKDPLDSVRKQYLQIFREFLSDGLERTSRNLPIQYTQSSQPILEQFRKYPIRDWKDLTVKIITYDKEKIWLNGKEYTQKSLGLSPKLFNLFWTCVIAEHYRSKRGCKFPTQEDYRKSKGKILSRLNKRLRELIIGSGKPNMPHPISWKTGVGYITKFKSKMEDYRRDDIMSKGWHKGTDPNKLSDTNLS